MKHGQCHLCRGDLTKSEEHIIPWSIGGRRVVTGFICKQCNSDTGGEWDSALYEVFKYPALLLGVKRQPRKGKSSTLPDTKVKATDGSPKILSSGGVWKSDLVRNRASNIDENGRFAHDYILSGDEELVMNEWQRLQESYEKKKENGKIVELGSYFHRQPKKDVGSKFEIEIGLDIHPPSPASKSIMKTFLAAAFDAGIDLNFCRPAYEYLKNNSDLIEYRVLMISDQWEPVHHVQIHGDPNNGRLDARIVFFGAIAVVVCLSDYYDGQQIDYSYEVDPVSGESVEPI